jgi:hypothetical protein
MHARVPRSLFSSDHRAHVSGVLSDCGEVIIQGSVVDFHSYTKRYLPLRYVQQERSMGVT